MTERLISVPAARAYIEAAVGDQLLKGCMNNVLDAIPAVDAVKVIRCKDCRFCKKHPTSDRVRLCTNERWNTEYHPFTYDNSFCSYGERRADGKT